MGILKTILDAARSRSSQRTEAPPLVHREPIHGSRRASGTLLYRAKLVTRQAEPFMPRGRYTGAMLREIRATGQARECARRLKQTAVL